eukprot:9280663-Prorocentrum_lima.AAC.1
MTSSLVGSEMCIRDRERSAESRPPATTQHIPFHYATHARRHAYPPCPMPVSYTHLTLPTICSV